jgi:protein-disulfide isomerase
MVMKGQTALRHNLLVTTYLLSTSFFVASMSAEEQTRETSSQDRQAEDKGESGEAAILRQLQELQNELRALRSEVGELRKAVNDIHRAAVRPRVPPAPSAVSLDSDKVMGSPEATIALVEFSDFQCPYCRRFYNQTFPQLKETYIDTGKLQFIFRDFPLEQIHREAIPAAVAANCSGQQGKYWEMHQALFSNQGRLGKELFIELAGELALDLPAFQSCLEDPEQLKEVASDQAYGQSIGVRGTPHYFIGRIEGNQLVDVKQVSGAQPFQNFQRIIDPLLQ